MAQLVSLSKPIKQSAKNTETQKKRTGRTVTIRARVPAMATLLPYRADEILRALNKYFGRDEFATVRVRK